jgi:hypothetical protein
LTKQTSKHPLANRLDHLDCLLPRGPIPLHFFKDLTTVRDSIVQADSAAKWTFFGMDREVAARYVDACERVDLSVTQLQAAIDDGVAQVSWVLQ